MKQKEIPYLAIVIVVAIVAVLILISNFKQAKVNETSNIELKAQPVSLSELQIQACNTANNAGTCNSRLPEVGIILADDCCQALGKCC